ncbi:MAG: hypothetical protein AB9835_08510 [Eubacteriales bacterium]
MLSRQDSRTILARCGLLLAAVLLSCALICGVWDTYLTLSEAAGLDAAARARDILQGMADTGNRAVITGNMYMLDGLYDKSGYYGMQAYVLELERINTLRKWGGGRVPVAGARTAVTVTEARRTVRGFVATAEFTTVYSINSAGDTCPAALEVSCTRELELRRSGSGYIIHSAVYSCVPTARIYRRR